MQLSYLGNGTGSNVDASAVLTDSKNRTVLLAEGVVMPKFIIDKDERNQKRREESSGLSEIK